MVWSHEVEVFGSEMKHWTLTWFDLSFLWGRRCFLSSNTRWLNYLCIYCMYCMYVLKVDYSDTKSIKESGWNISRHSLYLTLVVWGDGLLLDLMYISDLAPIWLHWNHLKCYFYCWFLTEETCTPCLLKCKRILSYTSYIHPYVENTSLDAFHL